MLKQLNIQNLILIESSEILFSSGFNVISGETGSGKSAILHALQLIKGERADVSLIRKGAEKGVVEAIFDISSLPHLFPLIEACGLQHDQECDLIIKREIVISGKSRAFVNNQSVQLLLLKKLGMVLFDLVGQHAHQLLKDHENYLMILDLFGECSNEVDAFGNSWLLENKMKNQLKEFSQNESQRLRDIERAERELKEIEEANLKENEEEELFSEYSLLSNAQELLDNSREIYENLSGERNPLLPQLKRQRPLFESLGRFSPLMSETAQHFDNAIAELQEISHTLRNFFNRIEENPVRMEAINSRLLLIDKLKKRYGPSYKEIENYRNQLKITLHQLSTTDDQIEVLSKKVAELEVYNHSLSQKLTINRSKAAKSLEQGMTRELQALNMPHALFTCSLKTQPRTKQGDDGVEFYLQPNRGENRIAVGECASGGELSRLMLAVHVLLSGKKQIPTLIFDEIDSNIGGETAVIVGKKLKEIGSKHQVLCITHFPQVAKQGEHHLKIEKREQEGRTYTVISILDEKRQQEELERMVGGSFVA